MKLNPDSTPTSSPQSLKELIQLSARELGFDHLGFARAQPLTQPTERLEQWLARGHHASMGWLETRRKERMNIHEYFPGARTMISLTMNYYTGTTRERINQTEGKVKISNYAWGDDYHRLIKQKLMTLKRRILDHDPSLTILTCVDTSPVMEKAWAEQAGLGWIGKHTNLITRDRGSWLFLAELILNIDLEPDRPFTSDLCGTCTACIDACPTQALTEYELDARKCISYLTIEHRGPLPEDLSDRFQGWIYGCDICQEVCPWNHKFSQPSPEPAFQPREALSSWTVIDWQQLDKQQFTGLFRHSAIKRTKFEGLKRNIQVAFPKKEPINNDE